MGDRAFARRTDELGVFFQDAGEMFCWARRMGLAARRQLGWRNHQIDRARGAVDADAIAVAHERNRTARRGLGPYMADHHREQQHEMSAMLQRRFGRDPRVRYVNLGPAVDLDDSRLSYDHMHLTAAGNAVIAGALVQPVLEMSQVRQQP